MNENSDSNSDVIHIEETMNGSVCAEGVNNGSEIGEILFEGHALVDSSDCAAGV